MIKMTIDGSTDGSTSVLTKKAANYTNMIYDIGLSFIHKPFSKNGE